jgi:hypothetical protein
MSMRRVPLVAAFLVLLRAVTAGHTEVPADFRTLVTSAETIARGHVTDVHGSRLSSGEIVSIVTVAVDDTLKGQAGPFASVIVPGGELGRVRTVVPGAPTLHVNDAAVFLLRRGPDNVWRLASMSSALYRLRRESETGRVVIDPPAVLGQTAGTGAVDRGSALRRPMSVPEFEALVRLVVQGRLQPIRRSRQ